MCPVQKEYRKCSVLAGSVHSAVRCGGIYPHFCRTKGGAGCVFLTKEEDCHALTSTTRATPMALVPGSVPISTHGVRSQNGNAEGNIGNMSPAIVNHRI